MEPETRAANDNSVIQMPDGLLGFERVKNYKLLTRPEEAPFMWLQMLDNPKRAFVVVPPQYILSDYNPDLSDLDVEFLELAEPSDAFVLNIVTVRGQGRAGALSLASRSFRSTPPSMPSGIQYPLPKRPLPDTLMLILSRKPGESIVIDGRITIKIMRLDGDVVKIGIAAPINVPVHRQEVYDEIQKNNQEALTNARGKLPRLTPMPDAATLETPAHAH